MADSVKVRISIEAKTTLFVDVDVSPLDDVLTTPEELARNLIFAQHQAGCDIDWQETMHDPSIRYSHSLKAEIMFAEVEQVPALTNKADQ